MAPRTAFDFSSRWPRVWRASVAIWALALVAVFAACSTLRDDDRRDLRDYAHNPDVPREDRVRTLMAILKNRNENTHLRATAAQMLGELKHRPAIDVFAELLGEREGIRPSESEWLRLETVNAMCGFGEAAIYRRALKLLYIDRRESSELIRRYYVQSFAGAEVGDRESAAVLVDYLRIVRDEPDEESITFRALVELRRITNRPDLNAFEFEKWVEQLKAMSAAN